MIHCDKCKKEFSAKQYLTQHKTKNPNCINKCSICLKTYSSKQSLNKHESVACKQKYECEKCNKVYKLKHDFTYHLCKTLKSDLVQKPNNNPNINNPNINDLIQNIPDNKQIIINNITNNTIYNNSNNVNKEINSNNKIGNKKLIIKNDFTKTKPTILDYGYEEEENKFKNYVQYNEDFDEQMADMYMYEEDQFKEKYKESIVLFEKKALELEGFKMLHTELQKDPKYHNVRIKKSKSGKCFVFNRKGWEEIPLQKAITKICSKLCNSLYDKETSVNQFLNLSIASQPRRMMDLRRHIEHNINNLNKDPIKGNAIEEV